MDRVSRTTPLGVSIAVVAVITAILWYAKVQRLGPDNPVFFYLLPITAVALLYGTRAALAGVIVAFVCADYFLYDPLYSLDISSRNELGDLSCFLLVAMFGVKCATKLFPSTKMRTALRRVIAG